MTARSVDAPDGVRITVDDAGRAGGPSIVFVHGFGQSRASFASVLGGPLTATHRLVAMDLRGHGDSDKPAGEGAYASERLGDDLHAVIEGLALRRSVVVAWSYGGVVLGEYLRRRGSGALGGVLLVAAAMQVGKPARDLFGHVMMSNARGLLADDDTVYAAAARAFVRGCPASPLDTLTVERAVETMLRVPVHARRSLLFHSGDYLPEIGRCTAPVATIHGALDEVVSPRMSELVGMTVPGCESSLVPDVGHMPWLEAPDAFDASLRAIGARAATDT